MPTTPTDDRQTYRRVIDRLVNDCREGQGQIGPRRVRTGVWNANATHDTLPDQNEINGLLSRLAAQDRDILARMLEAAFVSGVHQTLVSLHEAELRPFDDGYEGTPFHDFIGRLGGWSWPA